MVIKQRKSFGVVSYTTVATAMRLLVVAAPRCARTGKADRERSVSQPGN